MMIFEHHGELRYKLDRRNFWATGYYVSTVGLNTATIQKYIREQEKQDQIEDKLNNLPYVAESIIVQQNEKLVGLVYPDFDDAFAHGLNNDDIERVMEENRVALNAELPAYSQISKMKIYPEEFEKTPKKSIKRFLYQEAKG